MNNRHCILVLLLASVPSLGACSKPATTETAQEPAAEFTTIERTMQEVRRDVRKQVTEGNIKLSADDESLPRAEITPAGDLIIGGDKVAVDATQRALLMQYRRHVAGIAETGAEIGMQGAELATKAMGEAFRSLFSGDTDGMEQRVEAEAEKIQVQAQALCEQMPAMLETQQALADALPEFRPYATMEADDVSDCRDETQVVKAD